MTGKTSTGVHTSTARHPRNSRPRSASAWHPGVQQNAGSAAPGEADVLVADLCVAADWSMAPIAESPYALVLAAPPVTSTLGTSFCARESQPDERRARDRYSAIQRHFRAMPPGRCGRAFGDTPTTRFRVRIRRSVAKDSARDDTRRRTLADVEMGDQHRGGSGTAGSSRERRLSAP